MTKYKLKLNKTKMYQIMKDHCAGNQFPPIRQCVFSHFGSCYWMEFERETEDVFGSVIDYRVRVTVLTVMGITSMRVVSKVPLEDDIPECVHYTIDIRFEYLLKHGMLREVA